MRLRFELTHRSVDDTEARVAAAAQAGEAAVRAAEARVRASLEPEFERQRGEWERQLLQQQQEQQRAHEELLGTQAQALIAGMSAMRELGERLLAEERERSEQAMRELEVKLLESMPNAGWGGIGEIERAPERRRMARLRQEQHEIRQFNALAEQTAGSVDQILPVAEPVADARPVTPELTEAAAVAF